MTIKDLGVESTRHRRIYRCDTLTFEELPSCLNIASKRFVLFVASDVGTLKGIDSTLTQLLDLGCVFLCAWGPGCEELHDAMDDVVLRKDLQGASEGVIMTTWHDGDSLEETAEFAVLWALPDDDLANGCDTVILASVGNPEWGAELVRIGEKIVRQGVI